MTLVISLIRLNVNGGKTKQYVNMFNVLTL